MRKTHDELNLSDDEEEDLEAGDMEESMSMLCLSNENGPRKGGNNGGYDSVVLAGFFSEDDAESCEMITDTEEIVGDGDDESDSVKNTRSDGFKSSSGGSNCTGKVWQRRYPCHTMHKKMKTSNGFAARVSAVSGYYSCSQSRATSTTQPIDILYGGHTDFSGPKAYQASTRTKARRNLFKAREDRLAKAWERKRDQLLSEEFGSSDDNNYSESHSKTAHDSCGEEAKISSPRPDAIRAKSFTRVDLDELKGCLDLGFGFNYKEMPELSNTLPALELCYVMGQKFHDDINHHKSSPVSIFDKNADLPRSDSFGQSPIGNWNISSPGYHPEQVKERLKVWAQAVACTVRLCSS